MYSIESLNVVKLQPETAQDVWLEDVYKPDANGLLPRVIMQQHEIRAASYLYIVPTPNSDFIISWNAYDGLRSSDWQSVIGRRVLRRRTEFEQPLEILVDGLDGEWYFDDSEAKFYQFPSKPQNTFLNLIYGTARGRERLNRFSNPIGHNPLRDAWVIWEMLRYYDAQGRIRYITAMTNLDETQAQELIDDLVLQYGAL